MTVSAFAAVAAASEDADAKPVLVVETDPDFAPFDYICDDQFAGIDMDIVRAVCSEMGYGVEFDPTASTR